MKRVMSFLNRGYLDYFTEKGLTTIIGAVRRLWTYILVLELIANAADEIDDRIDKHIYVRKEEDRLGIYDNGRGFTEQALDAIYNFDGYASSKLIQKSLNRGRQGNALKAIIGISYINGFQLSFSCPGSKTIITKKLVRLSPPSFSTEKEAVCDAKGGVIILGIDISESEIINAIEGYRLSNPDITFHYNDNVYEAVANPTSRSKKTLFDWHTKDDFTVLVHDTIARDPNASVLKFVTNSFSRVRGKEGLDKGQFGYQKLSEYIDEPSLENLYKIVKTQLSDKKRDEDKLTNMFKKFLIGKKNVGKICDVLPEELTYAREIGEYEYDGAWIPFAFEGCLIPKANEDDVNIVSALNNALTYDKCPFDFRYAEIIFCKEEVWAYDVKSLLDKSGFTSAKGLTLFLHLLTPNPIITNKAKTEIDVTPFRDSVVNVLESLCGKTIRALRRNDGASADGGKVQKVRGKPSKESLMEKYFIAGFEHASGGKVADSTKKATTRQIFYSVRHMISIYLKLTLNPVSDYNTFSQDVVTQILVKNPELIGRVLFERRGFFYNSFDGSELPLGTADVLDFIRQVPSNEIRSELRTIYSIPLSRQFNKVLFVEKQGFNIILKESNVLDRLHMSVMSTQGFSNRASRQLMRYFIDQGIKVYALHDCDISGQLIFKKIHEGSKTFPDPLPEVVQIGLTLKDVDALGKRDFAEEYDSPENYANTLNSMSKDEQEFFFVGEIKASGSNKKKKYIYRRVELNTLTAPELVKYIESKIPEEPIDLPVEEIAGYIKIDHKEIVKEALYELFGEEIKLDIDVVQLAQQIRDETANSHQHWVKVLQERLYRMRKEEAKTLATKLRLQGFGGLDPDEID